MDRGKSCLDPSFFHLHFSVGNDLVEMQAQKQFVEEDTSPRSIFAWPSSEQNTPIFHPKDSVAVCIILPN